MSPLALLTLRVVTVSCYGQLLGASASFVGSLQLIYISANHPSLNGSSFEPSERMLLPARTLTENM